jgi:hypothetical protein
MRKEIRTDIYFFKEFSEASDGVVGVFSCCKVNIQMRIDDRGRPKRESHP